MCVCVCVCVCHDSTPSHKKETQHIIYHSKQNLSGRVITIFSSPSNQLSGRCWPKTGQMCASLLTDNEKICASNTRRDYVLIKRNLNNFMLILKGNYWYIIESNTLLMLHCKMANCNYYIIAT